jgi:hypothetical protein
MIKRKVCESESVIAEVGVGTSPLSCIGARSRRRKAPTNRELIYAHLRRQAAGQRFPGEDICLFQQNNGQVLLFAESVGRMARRICLIVTFIFCCL